MLTNSSSTPNLIVQLQARYPTASLIAEFVTVHQDHFVVRALVQVGGITLATGMAAATDIEQAEDRAKSRVLSALGIGDLTSSVHMHSVQPSSGQPQHAYSPSMTPRFNPSIDFISPETTHSAPSSAGQSLSQPLSFIDSIDSADFASSSPPEDDRVEYEFSYEPEDNQSENYGTESYNPESYSAENYESSRDTLPKIESVPESSPLSLDATDPTLVSSVASTSSPVPTPVPVPTKSTPSGKAKTTKRKSENTETSPSNAGENDRSEEIAKIGLEMKRLGWTTEQGRNYLKRTYGKRSRQELDDSELVDFLRYLESQVSPSESLF